MVTNLTDIMAFACKKEIAIGAFNVPNYESAQAIIAAANETGYPVILNYAPLHSPFLSMEDAAELMLYESKKAKVPVCVHLDHGASYEECAKAISLGFTSVMFDGSAKKYEDNVKETQDVVKMAHAMNITVEAELGHIFVSENGVGEKPAEIEGVDTVGNLDDVYTDPKLAKDFVTKTSVDCLAIAFGTSHGLYIKKPVLDLDRITLVRKEIDIPLVMHGGSGLSKAEFQGAIKNGIRKINYYTYMTLSGGDAVRNKIKEIGDDHVFFHDIPVVAAKAMQKNVADTIRIFAREV